MSTHPVSIADIAEAAGVSHSTVSRALRDSPLISVDTRARVRAIARDMGYTPNALAQSLQTRRSFTIGLVVTSIANPFYGDFMEGVEEVARPAGFSVLLSASHNDPDQEMSVIEAFHRRRVDGIIVASSRISSAYRERLHRIHVPTVLANSQAEPHDYGLHWVTVDDRAGAMLAVNHLLDLGHRRIGYLGVANRPRSNRNRVAAYRKALTLAGIAPREEWVVIAPVAKAAHEQDAACGQGWLPRLLEAGATAVFCYNDMVAIGAMAACREMGLDVPLNLSVVGYDDIEIARYVTPPLTTIHQPKLGLGRTAMQMLLDLLDDRPAQNCLLAPTLVSRASTAALAPALVASTEGR